MSRAEAFELTGKRALVTGASRGIGSACAKALANSGAWVACTDIAPVNDTVTAIENGGIGRAIGLTCDVSDEASVIETMAEVRAQIGRIDILVHCAGIMHEKPLLDTSVEEFDQVMAVNLRGAFLVGREAIRSMKGQEGRVVMIASDLSYLGRETFSPYVASKHGVMGLVRSWSKEFSPRVLVNAICPGPVDTAMLDQENMSPEWRRKELDIPMARFGLPEEIAKTAVFLAGDGASFITGQGIGVNGGSVMP